MHREKTHVLIAGGGVAALEAAIVLRKLAPDLVEVELLAPADVFTYRPLAVTLPFEEPEPVRYQLSELVNELGASLTRGALVGIDAWRHLAHTSTNRDVAYDVLLIASGALPLPGVEGAVMFRGPADAQVVRNVLDELERGDARSVAFVVPWGPAWPLPAYDLALLASPRPRSQAIWVVTPERQPLQVFGTPAASAVRELLAAHDVQLRTDAYAASFADGRLELVADEPLDVDRVVALPRLAGAPLAGIPQTVDGVVPVDDHGRVQGVADVFAAGDVTSFPVKHGGLATQQALAAAEMIAATVGAHVDPQPFRPVVHGLLLTGSEPRFLRRELHGIADTELAATKDALWWPPAKIAGRHLGPFLARFAGQPEHHLESPADALAVQVALDPDVLDRLDVGRFPTRDESTDEEMDAGTVSPIAVCEVAPEDTLGEIAERMLREDVSATLVCEYGMLVGIVTTHDLIGAFAARAHPSEARARQWMTAEPITLEPGSSHAAAARLMRAYGIRHVPLVEGDRPVGMLRLEDELPAKLPVGLGS